MTTISCYPTILCGIRLTREAVFGEGGLYGDPPYFCFNSDVNIHTDVNKSSHCGKGENKRDGNHENMIKAVSDSSRIMSTICQPH